MVSTRSSAGGSFPVPESYASGTEKASVDLSNGTFKDNGSAQSAQNGAAKGTDDVSGPMLEPSAFNRNWVSLHGSLFAVSRTGSSTGTQVKH